MDGINIKEVKPAEQTEMPEVETSGEPTEEQTTAQLPPWMHWISDEQIEVTTRKGVKYTLQDVEYDKVMNAKARTTGGKTDSKAIDNFEIALIAISLLKPKVTELELKSMKLSVIVRLRAAVYKLYDIESFLSQ